jgi:hypothetical protein
MEKAKMVSMVGIPQLMMVVIIRVSGKKTQDRAVSVRSIWENPKRTRLQERAIKEYRYFGFLFT